MAAVNHAFAAKSEGIAKALAGGGKPVKRPPTLHPPVYKFHVIAHATRALDPTRRAEQKRDPELKGLRWTLLKHRRRPDGPESSGGIDCLGAK